MKWYLLRLKKRELGEFTQRAVGSVSSALQNACIHFMTLGSMDVKTCKIMQNIALIDVCNHNYVDSDEISR